MSSSCSLVKLYLIVESKYSARQSKISQQTLPSKGELKWLSNAGEKVGDFSQSLHREETTDYENQQWRIVN